MKLDPNALVNLVVNSTTNMETRDTHFFEWEGGLTIHAELTSRNLAELLTNPDVRSEMLPNDIIEEAFRYADLLIAKLNKETQ